jgi:TnpA family transposase
MACASDSRRFATRGENLQTGWHVRYRRRGVLVYWHVERKSLAIFSQVISPSSSEVAAMIQGIVRHLTEMRVDRNYVDTHGQSEVAFAFCHLLGFDLLPRLKGIHAQKLYRPRTGQPAAYPNLQRVLTRPIDWTLIRQQYDEMVKYAAALLFGTADAESILRRFTRSNLQHPTYQALAELGRAVKTVFLCRYLRSAELRREIQEGLNVIENWHSANRFIFYGNEAELTSTSLLDQQISALSLHLLQNSLVYVNTLMLQQVLAQPNWYDQMTEADWRGLTPLFYSHINPYGAFRLNMQARLPGLAA